MSALDKIKVFKNKILGKKDGEEDLKELDLATEGYPSGEINFEEDRPEDRAKTIKKKAVIGIIAGVAVFAIAATVSTALSDKKEVKDKPLSNASSVGSPSQALPDKYSDIAKYQQQQANAEKKAELDQIKAKSESPLNTKSASKTTAQTQNQTSPQRVVVERETSSAPARVVPQSNSSANNTNKVSEAEKRQQAMFSSSLAFSVASGLTGSAEAAPVNTANINPQIDYYAGGYATSDYALNAGTIIPATLLTGITSDVPGGDVVAQIRQDVYDSLTGTHLLIPQGSRLIGTSGSAKAFGNKRIEVVFTRIILPNNVSLKLPEQKAIDGVGYPGLVDEYTEHKGAAYSSAFMAALLGAAAQSATGNTSGDDTRSPGQEAVSGAVAEILRTGEKFVDRALSKQPTITINPGYQFSVFINQDLLIGEYLDY